MKSIFFFFLLKFSKCLFSILATSEAGAARVILLGHICTHSFQLQFVDT